MVEFFILNMAKPMCDGFSMRRVLIGLENLFCKKGTLLFIYLFYKWWVLVYPFINWGQIPSADLAPIKFSQLKSIIKIKFT
jgi:hypothetical protein